MRYFNTNLVSVYRGHPIAMHVGFVAASVTGGVVSALLFHSGGYTMSAAVGRGVAVAAVTYALFLTHRWVGARLDAKRSGDPKHVR